MGRSYPDAVSTDTGAEAPKQNRRGLRRVAVLFTAGFLSASLVQMIDGMAQTAVVFLLVALALGMRYYQRRELRRREAATEAALRG